MYELGQDMLKLHEDISVTFGNLKNFHLHDVDELAFSSTQDLPIRGPAIDSQVFANKLLSYRACFLITHASSTHLDADVDIEDRLDVFHRCVS